MAKSAESVLAAELIKLGFKRKGKACEALISALTEKQYSAIEAALQKNAAENLALFTRP